MNPSTEDIVKAVKEVHARKVIILPNNKNIIMAAEQAAELAEEDVLVIPSKTVPQGMSALLAFNPGEDLAGNEAGMNEAMQQVKTGQLTYAVRDTSIDGLEIETGDFMGIAEGKIVLKDKDRVRAATALLENILTEDDEILTILKGEDATQEDVEKLIEFVEKQFGDVEVEVHNGGQPLYPFIFAIE